jgi:bifunctional non-homologous end joining protein LigD
LQQFKNTGKGNLVYIVFDLLHLDGHELQEMSLVERKSLLKDFVKKLGDKRVLYSEHVLTKGTALFKKAADDAWEGIIAKKADSVYEEGGRTLSWLKMKIVNQQEAVICGYTAPRGSRKKIGALVLGIYDKGKLRYIGHCGGGLNEGTIGTLFASMQPLKQATSPFSEKVKTNMPVTWVKPVLVCEVKFSSWTEGGNLRQPIFLGLREDKSTKDVHQETAKKLTMAKEKPIEKVTDGSQLLKLNGKQVSLTNQQKVYWPTEGITKGQLIDYYLSVAEYLLPHLKDRPLSLHRFPNGIQGMSFYQKDMDLKNTPVWIKSIPLHSESTNKNVDYLICNNEATLAYMINLGCIEVNPWLARVKSLDNPDYIILDLDPDDIAFKAVVETALCIKEVLDGFKVSNYCKTSGATGLHIYIPTGAKYDFDTCRLFAEFVARAVQQQLKSTTSVIRMKSKRKKKVYIDFLQNRRGQTVASPYSVRPQPGATVSTPLLWEEVNSKLNIKDYNIWNTLDRLKQKGDLWLPVLNEKNDLRKAIRQIENTVSTED